MNDATNPQPVSSSPALLEEAERILQSPVFQQQVLPAIETRIAAAINKLPAAGTGTPGWRTSEFWCLVVFSLLALFTMLAGVLPAKWALACQAVSVGLYQISRGLTKHGTGN